MPETTADIDDMRPAFLREPYTLGSALQVLEMLTESALNLSLHGPTMDEAQFSAQFNEWFRLSVTQLVAIFTSRSPALRFLSSQEFLPLDPPLLRLLNRCRTTSLGLIAIRQEIVEQRERISTAAEALAIRVSESEPMLAAIRDTNSMTEELWLKMKSDRFLNPYLRRLLDLGLDKKLLYDVLKWGAITVGAKVVAG